MLRFALLAAALAAFTAAPARGQSVELFPGVTYEKQLQLTPFGPQVVHVVTAPRPGGLYALKPVLSNGAILGREPVTAIERRLAPTPPGGGGDGDHSPAGGGPTAALP